MGAHSAIDRGDSVVEKAQPANGCGIDSIGPRHIGLRFASGVSSANDEFRQYAPRGTLASYRQKSRNLSAAISV
jgi:hypothetical protein